jgi:hypothetical protein
MTAVIDIYRKASWIENPALYLSEEVRNKMSSLTSANLCLVSDPLNSLPIDPLKDNITRIESSTTGHHRVYGGCAQNIKFNQTLRDNNNFQIGNGRYYWEVEVTSPISFKDFKIWMLFLKRCGINIPYKMKDNDILYYIPYNHPNYGDLSPAATGHALLMLHTFVRYIYNPFYRKVAETAIKLKVENPHLPEWECLSWAHMKPEAMTHYGAGNGLCSNPLVVALQSSGGGGYSNSLNTKLNAGQFRKSFFCNVAPSRVWYLVKNQSSLDAAAINKVFSKELECTSKEQYLELLADYSKAILLIKKNSLA